MTETAAQDIRRTVRGDVWPLKWIHYIGAPTRIICQNLNGPCSLISLCNVLILRGTIAIEPPERTSVSYEYLSALLADVLVRTHGGTDDETGLSAALGALPKTAHGMDLNPSFTSADAFRPSGDGGELKLFSLADIILLHGWLADPDSAEYDIVARFGDYDSAVNAIVEADYTSEGRVVGGEAEADFSQLDKMSEDHKRKLQEALTLRAWIDSSSSQLTYYGLFALSSSVKPGQLAALFRNSHLSVLYKPPKRSSPKGSSAPTPSHDPFADMSQDAAGSSSAAPADDTVFEISTTGEEDGPLYSLVTDAVFANEPTIVWERLEDVEGGASSFFDAHFRPAHPAGGDYAGATAETAMRAIEQQDEDETSRADHELAFRLQQEEDAHAHALYAEQERLRQA
ncbi:DUF544-domain-containing protein [Auriculariales sp. MPI-PUGE-AT-0066]|nr:DUF544-domain-containing protein [Auriculariales sp. MPI-PUGE-AT-0066]